MDGEGAGSGTGDAAGEETRSATLVLRAWTEADSDVPRARLLAVAGQRSSTWSTAVGEGAIAREVLRWLQHAVRQGTAHRPPPARPDGAPALVDGAWLEEHLHDPAVVVVEVDGGPGSARAAGPEGHVPGAARITWADLHHPVRRGPPAPDAFAALMDGLGVHPDTHVVLCADGSPGVAAAACWLWAYCGHRRTSLLDGGRQEWVAQGRPVARLAPRQTASGYPVGQVRHDLLLTRDQLLAGFVGAPPGTALLDCRSAEEFSGQPRPDDDPAASSRVPGHVPGAVNLPVEELLRPGTALLRPAEELHRLLAERGLSPSDHVVVYCGVGERSPLVWFVLHELLRWPDVRCYPGGWAEYGSLVDVPVEVG